MSGSSSAVERQLPKLDVAGSIPVSRSINPRLWRDPKVVCGHPNPVQTSTYISVDHINIGSWILAVSCHAFVRTPWRQVIIPTHASIEVHEIDEVRGCGKEITNRPNPRGIGGAAHHNVGGKGVWVPAGVEVRFWSARRYGRTICRTTSRICD